MLCCRPRVVGPLSALAGFHRYEGVEDCDDNLSEFDWSLPEHANSVGGGSFNTPPSVDTANAAPAATFLALKFTAQHISAHRRSPLPPPSPFVGPRRRVFFRPFSFTMKIGNVKIAALAELLGPHRNWLLSHPNWLLRVQAVPVSTSRKPLPKSRRWSTTSLARRANAHKAHSTRTCEHPGRSNMDVS